MIEGRDGGELGGGGRGGIFRGKAKQEAFRRHTLTLM